jgi:hypothetical protein
MGTANRKRVIQSKGGDHMDKADLKLKKQPAKIVSPTKNANFWASKKKV